MCASLSRALVTALALLSLFHSRVHAGELEYVSSETLALVAVYGFTSEKEEDRAVADEVAKRFVHELVSSACVRTAGVAAQDINLRAEAGRDCSSSECQLELAGKAGANFLVHGTLAHGEDSLTLRADVYDVTSGKSLHREEVPLAPDQSGAGARRLSRLIGERFECDAETPTFTGSTASLGVGNGPVPAIADATDSRSKGLAIAAEAARRQAGFRSMIGAGRQLHFDGKKRAWRRFLIQKLEVSGVGEHMLFVYSDPADVEGTAFLSRAEPDGTQAKWLYLPALKRVRRLSPEFLTRPFLGTAFNFEDLSSAAIGKFTYEFLDQTKLEVSAGEDKKFYMDTYRVRRTPVEGHIGCTHQDVYYDVEQLRLQEMHCFNNAEKLTKKITFAGYVELPLGEGEKRWFAKFVSATDLETGHHTHILFEDVGIGELHLKDEDFSPNKLSK